MKISKLSPKIIIGILVAVIFGIALLLRIVIPHEQAFNGELVKFTSIDAYFYQRILDNMSFNFPHFMSFDPYFIYPGGHMLTDIFFPDWFMSGLVWLFSAGSPTQHLVDMVGSYFPAIIAALTVIPVYFIGKTLFNRWVGVIAAALIAILPGEFLGRTIIGLNDTPAFEIFLTAAFMCFVILAVKAARDKGFTLDHLRRREWSMFKRPLIYSLLAGLFLGMFLLSWMGALLFVFIFVLYLVIQFINDHLRKQSTDYLAVIGVVPLLVALIIYFRFAPNTFYLMSLVLALFIPVVLIIVSRVMTQWKVKPFYFPVALVVLGGIALLAFHFISPGMFKTTFSAFSIFAPTGATAQTTIEMQPLLDPTSTGSLSTALAWGNFTTSFFLFPGFAFPGLALIALSILIYLFVRRSGNGKSLLRPVVWVLAILAVVMVMLLTAGYGQRILAFVLLIVLFGFLFLPGRDRKHWLPFIIWTLVILFLTLAQRRFAYYLVVNIAVLSAYLFWQVLWLAGLRKLAVEPAPAAVPVSAHKAKARKQESRRQKSRGSLSLFYTVIAGIAAFFLVFYPNIPKAAGMVTPPEAPYAPSDAWVASLQWLRDNTPDPFGDPAAYYRIYEPPPPGEDFQYPASAYGVTSWWDYGYWITQIAHRLPSANPGQEPARIINVADLFLSVDDAAVHDLLAMMDSSYVIIDNQTILGKFWAVATWAGQSVEKYSDYYYVSNQSGQLQLAQFFTPDYYRTLAVRLYNFDGKAVTNVKAEVITWVDKKDSDGTPYKEVTDYKEFTDYQQAVGYLNGLTSGNHIIVGPSPFISPVPLEAVPDFKVVYSSKQGTSQPSVGFIPEVKIFEYAGKK